MSACVNTFVDSIAITLVAGLFIISLALSPFVLALSRERKRKDTFVLTVTAIMLYPLYMIMFPKPESICDAKYFVFLVCLHAASVVYGIYTLRIPPNQKQLMV
jgi:hypothetical membrane protein